MSQKKIRRERLTRQNRGGEETWEVWRALKKLELLAAAPRTTLKHLSCSPNFPRASITRYTHAKHEQLIYFRLFIFNLVTKLCLNSRKKMQYPWLNILTHKKRTYLSDRLNASSI